MDNIVAAIYTTTDYEKFKFVDGNRDINHAKKIAESIEQIGVLYQPVLVNERFEIIDGQGRFLAMKTLGLPILYVIQNGLGIKHVRYLNYNSTNWVMRDYVHSYAVGEEKKDNYVNFECVRKQFPEFNERVIVAAGSEYGLANDNLENLRNGKLKGWDFNAMNMAIKRLGKLREINQSLNNVIYKHRLLPAVMYCIALQEREADFSIEQLGEAIREYYGSLEPAKSIYEAIEKLDYCYNYKRRKANRYNIVRKYEDTLDELGVKSAAKARRGKAVKK